MHAFVHNLFGGVGSVGSRESLQMMDSHTFFMISSVEWEAWEDQNHLKYVDFMRCQDFVRWSWKPGKPRITKQIFFHFPKQIGGVGSVRSLESLQIQIFV